MVSKNSLFSAVVMALVVGMVMPGAVGAAAPCPDYSGKVVSANATYWFIQNGQRWALVDREAAATWGKTILSARSECVNDLSDSGGLLSYRAGTRLIKKAGADGVYALGPQGKIHLIDSPEVAARWYGPRWGSLLRTVSEEMFNRYTMAEPVTLELPNDRVVVRQSGQSRWYQLRDGQLVRITGLVPPAIYNNTRVLSAELFNKIPMSDATITSAEVLATVTPAVR